MCMDVKCIAYATKSSLKEEWKCNACMERAVCSFDVHKEVLVGVDIQHKILILTHEMCVILYRMPFRFVPHSSSVAR